MASATFHYRAVAPDGKLRTGVITAESNKTVARELTRQGLTPVYVGLEEKKSSAFKLPSVELGAPPRRPLLHPGTLDAAQLRRAARPRALNHQRTHHSCSNSAPSFSTSCAPSKAANRWRTRSRFIPLTSPTSSSTWCEPAKHPAASARSSSASRNSNAPATNFAATSFPSMIYPGLLACVGVGSIFVILNFVVPRFASIFDDSRMKIPLPTLIMLQASHIVQAWWWVVALVLIAAVVGFRFYIATPKGRFWWDTVPSENSHPRRRAAESRDIPVRPRHVHAGREQRAAGAVAAYFGRYSVQQPDGELRSRKSRRE